MRNYATLYIQPVKIPTLENDADVEMTDPKPLSSVPNRTLPGILCSLGNGTQFSNGKQEIAISYFYNILIKIDDFIHLHVYSFLPPDTFLMN